MEAFLEGICKPLLIYSAFMAALITYDITQKDIKSAGKNSIFLALGGIGLFFLCSSGFEVAAWILLAIPPFFFVALLALLVVTQIFKTHVNYDDGSSVDITGGTIKRLFGIDLQQGLDHVAGDVSKLVGQPYVDACTALPLLPSADRIAQELAVSDESQCNTCA
jgi:hypothetical protein